MHIVFLHIDLGIGGAEQLIVNLALASISEQKNDKRSQNPFLNASVSICTTHCDPTHCFASVKPPDGILATSVHVVGKFLPVQILGKYGTAFCSTLRLLYLAAYARYAFPKADLYVVDILPTPIPFLIATGASSVLYYCHFPDKLLKRDTINGVVAPAAAVPNRSTNSFKRIKQSLQTIYRRVLSWAEEWSMLYSDSICVNSKFTQEEVLRVFPSIPRNLTILYPAIDLDKFILPDMTTKEMKIHQSIAPIVSLNRFERKKNIQLLLESYALLKQRWKHSDASQDNSHSTTTKLLPPLVIAGGYDPRNNENHEYLQELQSLCMELGIQDCTSFRPSISDADRATLLQSALCLCYTPFREHFGIVPLEAMYAGSAVIALKSGGPMETVVDGETGFLIPVHEKNIDETTKCFSDALWYFIENPKEALQMGKQGHEHVKKHFGFEKFRDEWKQTVIETIQRGRLRRKVWKSTFLIRFMLILLPLVYYIYKKI